MRSRTQEGRLSFTRLCGHQSRGGYGVDHGRGEEAEAGTTELHRRVQGRSGAAGLDEGKTIPQVARDLDLTQSALRTWVERARADRSKGKTGLTSEERAELARLRKEVRELRMEREILKKAAAFFAKEHH
jgi:transposase